jgi:hypothetical protein
MAETHRSEKLLRIDMRHAPDHGGAAPAASPQNRPVSTRERVNFTRVRQTEG